MKRIQKVSLIITLHIVITISLIGVSAINNMKQLEYLVRLHIMIAMVYGDGDEKCLQNFLVSLSYIMLIWKVCHSICAMY